MAIAFLLFCVFVIALELFTGSAVVGWTGDNMVVDREEKPGPYWFAIVVQVLMVGAVAAVVLLAR